MRYFCPTCNRFTEVHLRLTSKVFKPVCSECGHDYVRQICKHCGEKTLFEEFSNRCGICHESNDLPEHDDILTEQLCLDVKKKYRVGLDCNSYIPALLRTIESLRSKMQKTCIYYEEHCALYPRSETMPDCRTCSSYANTHK